MPRARNAKPEVVTPKRATKRKVTPRKPTERTRRMSMVERMRLAERITVARTKPRPDPWAEIAKREKQPERTCQAIYAEYQEDMARLGDNTGQPILAESLMLYTLSIERLAHEAEHADNASARIGAIRTMLDALKGRIELLAVLGRMPRSFRALDELAALQRFVRRLSEIVEAHQLPADVVHEFVALADEIQPVIEGTPPTVAQLPRAS